MPPKRKRVVKEVEPEEDQPVAKKPRLTKKASSNLKKKDAEQMEIEDQPAAKVTVTPKLARGTSKAKAVVEEKKDVQPLASTPTKPKLSRAATQILAADPEDLWGNILPDEILFQIFTYLHRQELWNCRFVSTRWGQLSQDEALGWHLAASVLFMENLVAYSPNNPNYNAFTYITPGTPQEMELLAERDTYLEKHKGAPVSFNMITPNQNYAWQQFYELWDKDQDIVGYARLHPKPNSTLNTLPTAMDLLDDKLWNVKITPTTVAQATEEKYQLWNVTDSTRMWKVEIDINVRRFETLVRNGGGTKRIPGEAFIQNAMQDAFQMSVYELLESKGPYIPKKSLTAEKQPEGFKGIKLYKYQLDAISWMKSIENDLMNNSVSFCRAIPWRQARSDVMLHVNPQDYYGKKYFVLPEEVNGYISKLTPRGGILADEMGLGKTMEIIGLILANPTDVDPDDVEQDEPFKSRATLVLCPNHLAKQWQQEIEKVTTLKVALCSTINQLKAYSYDDFVNYDVIVFTYQLMQNPNYFYTGTTKSTYIKKRAAQTDRPVWVTNQLRAVHRAKDPMAKTCPLLEHFKFHRIVMDEAHEYITQEFYKCSYPFLHYNSLWYVTGTPFPNHQTMVSLLEYIVENPTALGITQNTWNIGPEIMSIVDVLLRTVYWRHTKESVKGEYEIPDCVEELVLLEFSELEKIMYEGMDPVDEEYNRRLLCSFSQTVSLSMFAENLVNQKQNEIRWQRESKAELERAVKQKTLDRKDALLTNPAKASFYEKEINNLNKEITKSENKIARYENMIGQLKDYPKYDKRKKEALKAIKKDSEKEEKASQLDMIEFNGSKMANVVSFMKKLLKNPENRAIVFSSFPQVLKNASELFNEHNIEHVFVEGNVWRKTKAITNFKKDTDVRVIILSLQSAASGTNLMEASHVILLDPVSGTKKEAQAVESQAIGRAYRQGQTKQVTVVRFIVKNTIEHITYMRNNDVSNDTQVVTDKDNKPQLVKSSSFSVLVANKPSLQRSGSITNLLEGKLDQSEDMEESGNNTNVMKK